MEQITKELESTLGGITEDLKSIAKKYGAVIVIALVVVYLYKKIKN